ncbi:MAG: LysM peptidoglycan-binding domain-containing protein, partial [Pseudomonadota bacterium]|nr:LysM peptidoglycan-binding domain-containing protein [Pseudomonadota bacterium]
MDGPVQALPAPRPAWEARPVAPDAQTISTSSYEGVAGDTLRGIAERTGAGLDAIAQANNLPP